MRPRGTHQARIAAILCLALVSCAGGAQRASGVPPAGSGAPAPAAAAAPAASASQAAPMHNAAVQQLIDGARGEGELNVIWSSSFFHGGDALPEIVQAFNAYYGLNTRINRTVGPSMPQMAARLIQEAQAGKPPSTDLYHGSDEHIAMMLAADVLQPVDWRALDPRIPAEAVAEKNVAVAYGTWFPGITYNEQLVPASDVPRTLKDVLDPRWKGLVASTPYAAGFYRLALSNEWGGDATTAYVQQLADQVGGLIRCGEYERILSGEFLLHALNCGVNVDQQQHADGKPIGFVIPADAIHASYYTFAVPKGSAHPNTATLFALFMLTEEGQRLSYQADFLDLDLLPGSGTAALIKPLLDQGNRLMGEDGMVQMSKYADESAKYERELARILAKQ
ncbi:MAG TPA: extracellular solute-binding protein [Chloroflexota bacterium]|nr:extracellular solute-binding protein [Chloroflexota bacterium]